MDAIPTHAVALWPFGPLAVWLFGCVQRCALEHAVGVMNGHVVGALQLRL